MRRVRAVSESKWVVAVPSQQPSTLKDATAALAGPRRRAFSGSGDGERHAKPIAPPKATPAAGIPVSRHLRVARMERTRPRDAGKRVRRHHLLRTRDCGDTPAMRRVRAVSGIKVSGGRTFAVIAVARRNMGGKKAGPRRDLGRNPLAFGTTLPRSFGHPREDHVVTRTGGRAPHSAASWFPRLYRRRRPKCPG